MHKITGALVVCLAVFGCRGSEDGDTDHMGGHGEFDEARLLEVKASYEKYADIGLLASEMITDEAGCEVPKWENTIVYAFDPATLHGMGVHFLDISYPVDQYEEERVRIIMYDLSPTGGYEIAGLEWYFETANGEALEETPSVFGVPMAGIMEGHTPDQGMHYDIHGWLWKTSPENEHGYFGDFNPGMTVPDFWLEVQDPLFAAFAFFDPSVAPQSGYVTDGMCMSAAEGDYGVKHVNDGLVGTLDPFAPDTVLTDINGLFLGVQWTYPDDGSGPPTLFQQPFSGPDADGNYTLRLWMGTRTNALGIFAPAFPYPLCSEAPIPAECLGGPPA